MEIALRPNEGRCKSVCVSASSYSSVAERVAEYERQQALRREWDRITIPKASAKDKAHLFYLVA